jgi:8-hydroxy-5-deazaflavin:NADPH oxidoreductase
MRIAILGAGNVGSAVARAGLKAGHQVVLSATSPDKARAVAGAVGGSAAASNREAVADADMVVLAVPYGAVGRVAEEIGPAVRGKVVVDATNPMREDLSGLAVSERSGAEEIQRQLPGASVVKAFNTVFAANQAEPEVDGTGLDGFYAGDDEQAKQQVAAFLAAIGYRPVDAGPLAAALALENMAFLNIALNARNNWPWQSGWKLVGPGPGR